MVIRISRSFTVLLIATIFSLLAMHLPAVAAGRSVLLVILDDFGMDKATFYPVGPYRKATQPAAPPMPNLTRMAQAGVLFGNAWVQQECSPTRATIVTGQYAFRRTNGVGEWIAEGRPSLPAASFTLPEAFRTSPVGRGFMLAHIGKWHLSRLSEGRSMPMVHGWPYYEGPVSGGALNTYQGYFEYAAANGIVQPARRVPGYATTHEVDDALAAIGRARSAAKPYFMTLALNAPHAPYSKPPNSLHHLDGLPDAPASGKDLARAYYAAMVEAIDTELGRLLRSVDLKTTTVLVIGDNGTPGAVTAPPYPSERAKSSLYEGGVRVPLLVFGAGVQRGRIVDSIVAGVDLYPTILQLAGIDPAGVLPAGNRIDGVSLVPSLTGAKAPTAPVHPFVYSDTFIGAWNVRPRRAIRDATFKLIDEPGTNDKLFNLKADPMERKNLLAAPLAPAAVAAEAALRAQLASLLSSR